VPVPVTRSHRTHWQGRERELQNHQTHQPPLELGQHQTHQNHHQQGQEQERLRKPQIHRPQQAPVQGLHRILRTHQLQERVLQEHRMLELGLGHRMQARGLER